MRSALAVAAALVAGAAQAAPMTYTAALDQARASAPSLQAKALQVEAARSAARAAGALPDPKLTLGIDNFPVSGPMAGRLGADQMTMARVGVMQDMPNRAKRRARSARAEADIVTASAEGRVEARDVEVATATAWLNLHFAQRRLAALDEVLGILEPLWRAAPAGVASGGSRPAQALQPDQLRLELEDRRSELAAAAGRARAALARWTGDPAPEATGPAPTFAIDSDSLRRNLERHPRLVAMDAETAEAEAEVRLARADKRPDWSWELAYQRRNPMFGDMVSAGVTVSLPLFARSRQDPLIAARVSAVSQARAEREAARRSLTAELESSLADHLMHQAQWVRARDTLLPLAGRRADLETASYAAGSASLADVLEAFTGRANTQLTVIDREALVATDAARLTLTYGADQ